MFYNVKGFEFGGQGRPRQESNITVILLPEYAWVMRRVTLCSSLAKVALRDVFMFPGCSDKGWVLLEYKSNISSSNFSLSAEKNQATL